MWRNVPDVGTLKDCLAYTIETRLMDVQAAIVQCGSNLRHIRIAKRFSVKSLAGLSGIDVQEIHGIETGNGDAYLTTLLQLAEVLDVDLCCILIDPGFRSDSF